jgi:hypothetical protein
MGHGAPLPAPALGRGETVGKIEPCPWPVRGIAPVYTQTPFANGLDPNPYYRG